MKTSNKGMELIKRFEGCRLAAYKCPAGVWTIGYGHTASVYQGQVISQETAETLLRSDLLKYEQFVTNNVNLELNQGQFDALVSFTYNCGLGNLKSLIKNRNQQQIANALLLYNKAAGKVLAGLTRRRQEERSLFLSELALGKTGNPFAEPSYTLYRGRADQTPDHVRWMQFELNEIGYGLVVDGAFGKATDAALRDAQARFGLVVDGKCGSATREKLKAV